MKEKEIEQVKQKIVNLYNSISTEENEKITNIQFYKEMQILSPKEDSIGLEEDVYIVEKEVEKENNSKEKIYELYLEEGQRVAVISKEGEIVFDEAYIELLKERYKQLFEKIKIEDAKVNVEELLEENEEKEKIEMTQEEIEEKETEQKDIEEKEDNQDNEQEEVEKDEEEIEEVSKAAGISEKEMRACTKINPSEKITDTENFYDIVPNTKKYEKIYVVASNRNTSGNSKFHFVGITKEGIAEQIEDLEPTEGVNTSKEVISINRDGSEIKEKQVSALFKVGDYNKGFSVSIGDYGIIEAEYVRRTRDNQYIGSNINTTTQKPTTKEVKEFMSDARNPYIQDNVEKAEKQIEENENGETNIQNIDDDKCNDTIIDVDEKIEFDDGNITTIRKEAEKSGLSLDEYVRRCEEEQADTIQEKIEEVNEEIEEQKTNKIEEEMEEDGEERTPWGDAYRRMNRMK